MALDATGWPQPTGEFETIEADTLVLALGQNADTRFLEAVPGVEIAKDGVVQVDAQMMTGHEGVFCGGDMVPAERTVTVAVGHGKKAARNIDAYLRGETYQPAPKHDVAEFEMLNAWYYSDADQSVQPALDLARRQAGFAEIKGGLDEGTALFEVLRQLLRVRQLLRRLPGQRGDQARARQTLPLQRRLLQGLRPLRRRMPLRCHRDGARDDLNGGGPHAPDAAARAFSSST
jgi:hypothetical protein